MHPCFAPRNIRFVQTDLLQDPPRGRKKREQQLSKNGKWRSFPRVPNLLQYVSSGIYFGKVKIGGKKIRLSLQTDVWSVAVGKLPDFLKTNRLKGSKTQAPKFMDAAERFRDALPHGELATIAECGHNVASQNTKGFLAALTPFLASRLG